MYTKCIAMSVSYINVVEAINFGVAKIAQVVERTDISVLGGAFALVVRPNPTGALKYFSHLIFNRLSIFIISLCFIIPYRAVSVSK